MLKWTIKNLVVGCGLDSSGLEYEAGVGSFEYGSEPPGRTLLHVLE
jgi:hypothetical protein